jgi:asparagine synthase (glutamine-hydrolysing)
MSEVSGQPVETFSVTFGEKEFDESYYSNLIAKKYSTRHTRVNLTPADFLNELPNALKSTDSPSGDGINTFVVSKATKQAGISVALSGLGGDELFAGYPNFIKWIKSQKGLFPKMPKFLRRSLATTLSFSGNSKQQRLVDVLNVDKLNLTAVYPMFRQVISRKSLNDLCPNGDHIINIQIILSDRESAIEKFPLLSQFSIAEILGYAQNVLLKDTDQFSMASSLEVREPFFDYKLVEYVLQIPDEIKYPRYPKSLLVDAISPMLPDEIVHRKKVGFVLPWETWMRHELRDFCQSRIESLAERGILDSDKVLHNWDRFLKGSWGSMWSQNWHLVVLAEWLDNNKF